VEWWPLRYDIASINTCRREFENGGRGRDERKNGVVGLCHSGTAALQDGRRKQAPYLDHDST
jgi:hypothetical protein